MSDVENKWGIFLDGETVKSTRVPFLKLTKDDVVSLAAWAVVVSGVKDRLLAAIAVVEKRLQGGGNG